MGVDGIVPNGDNDSKDRTPVGISGKDMDSKSAVDDENDPEKGNTTKIRMLEFFSGIGGMRLSLEKALRLLNNNNKDIDQGSSSSSKETIRTTPDPTTTKRNSNRRQAYVLGSCRAYDISLHANNIYQHNFCNADETTTTGENDRNHHSVCTKLVEQLKPRDIAPLKANLWTMSPPCQPFTTNGEGRGKQRLDASDKRCNGLKGIMKLLEGLAPGHKPRYIFLENVRGFADSTMCELWCDCLVRNGYSYKAFVLSPVEFGIPNHRKRYYLMAELDSKRWSCNERRHGPENGSEGLSDGDENNKETRATTPLIHGIASLSTYDIIAKRPIQKVGKYLDERAIDETRGSNDFGPYLVPDKVLSKAWAKGLGIVSGQDTATHCFTAGYGRIYHQSTGSLLLIKGSKADEFRKGASLETLPLDRSDMTTYEGQLRRFTPEELLRLFGFVSNGGNDDDDRGSRNENVSMAGRGAVFEIPSSVVPSLEQRYKLIGNSISVNVVTELLQELLISARVSPKLVSQTTT